MLPKIDRTVTSPRAKPPSAPGDGAHQRRPLSFVRREAHLLRATARENPVDCVLEQWRDRTVVLGQESSKPWFSKEQLLEGDSLFRQAHFCLEVLIEQRHFEVGKADERDVRPRPLARAAGRKS